MRSDRVVLALTGFRNLVQLLWSTPSERPEISLWEVCYWCQQLTTVKFNQPKAAHACARTTRASSPAFFTNFANIALSGPVESV